MPRVLVVTGMLLAMTIWACAAATSPAVVTCPRMSTAPTIDGLLGAGEWTRAAVVGPMVLEGAGMPSVATDVYVGYDDEALYIGAFLADRAPTELRCAATESDGAVEADDALTIWLDPGSDGVSVIKLVVNAAGVTLDAIDANTEATAAWRSATGLEEDGWGVEIAYEYGAAGVPAPASEWGFNVRRNAPRMYERASMTGSSALGTLRFQTPALRCEVEPISSPWFGRNTMPVRLTNLSGEAQAVKVNVRVTGKTRRAHFFDTTKLTLAPGESSDLAMQYEVQRGGRCEVGLSVQVVRGATAVTALRTAEMPFELPPLGEQLDLAVTHIADAYETWSRLPDEARAIDAPSQLEMLLARWRYLDSQQQRRAALTPDVMMALVNRAQALSQDAILLRRGFEEGAQ